MKKVLIITYYWPPSGGAGVQRWLKFSKYLPAFNIQPVIFTPSNPEFPVEDFELLKDIPKEAEVIKIPIWEPYQLYKKFTGKKKDDKLNAGFTSEKKGSTLTESISVWIRGNLFIPDARKFWIKPASKYLIEYLQKNTIDTIISTGPPHSMHLIALHIKKKFNHINWIADFRDPWTNIDYYKDLKLSAASDKKHHEMEKSVLENADHVISVGSTLNDELKTILNHSENKFKVILNGFDEDDYPSNNLEKDQSFSIAHIGTMAKSRNPDLLWEVLHDLCCENENFKKDLQIKLIGKVDHSVLSSIEQYKLKDYLKKTDYLPHNEVIIEQMKSRVLLLIVNQTPNAKGILTGKFFEYMASKSPVLCIGPEDGDLAKILYETKCGLISNYSDKEKLKQNILKLYSDYKNKTKSIQAESIQKYSRKNLTAVLADLILSKKHD